MIYSMADQSREALSRCALLSTLRQSAIGGGRMRQARGACAGSTPVEGPEGDCRNMCKDP